MKNDVKTLNKRFLKTLLSFIGVIILVILTAIITNLFIKSEFIYVVYFALLLGMVFVLSIFKVKLAQITEMSYLIKIRANQASPLTINYIDNYRSLGNRLFEMDFKKFSADQFHILYYKVSKDEIKKIFRRYMLEVVVIIKKRSDPFYLDIVDEEIGKIQQKSLKNRKKIDRMFISQIKEIDDLDVKTKELIREIVFVKTNTSVISVINIGLHRPSNKAIMLFSDSYSPSLYYNYHIEQIKKIV